MSIPPTYTQKRALQIIKLTSEQEDETERLRNVMRWVIGMLGAGDDKEKIIQHIEASLSHAQPNNGR